MLSSTDDMSNGSYSSFIFIVTSFKSSYNAQAQLVLGEWSHSTLQGEDFIGNLLNVAVGHHLFIWIPPPTVDGTGFLCCLNRIPPCYPNLGIELENRSINLSICVCLKGLKGNDESNSFVLTQKKVYPWHR